MRVSVYYQLRDIAKTGKDCTGLLHHFEAMKRNTSVDGWIMIGTSIRTKIWVEDEASTGQLYRPSLLTSTTDSLVGCLTICSSTVKHKGSTYNTETRECNCLDGNVSVTSHPGNRLWNRQFEGFFNLQLGWYIKLFANMQMSQSQAEAFCGTLGARLAILDTNEKVDYVTALPDYPADRFVFVGATDKATERMFLWSNGANANHIRWGHGDPG
ncbi:brevican core protein-like [Pecten maximus]|uniref:brevican core protein-like n=1 Tax=Pecten maximus TaxID=6579 RepID=UPI001458CF5D|nr:brevican core protein-like [Pecten maximus]